MPTIADQKYDLRSKIIPMVMDEYEGANEEERLYLFAGTIRRLAKRMTLQGLKDWYDKLERLNDDKVRDNGSGGPDV